MEQTAMSFDAEQWNALCDQLADEAIRRCGCIHDMYQKIFSELVDVRLSEVPSCFHAVALEAARYRDYLDVEERAAAQEEMAEQGYCTRGLDPDCCPMGCGDLVSYSGDEGA